MKNQLFLLLLALSVLRTQAQSLSIKGRVTDASQEAVIAANVSLWTIDSTLVTGVTSDAQGKFALHKIKAGDYRLSISFIGLQSENILLKLNKSLDLGDVQLQEDAVSLGEVTVSASNVLQRVDRQIILPSESQLKRSFGTYDLLNNLGIARLQVDNLSNSMSVSGGGSVQTRINGIKVTDKEIAAVRAKDVLRVEFIEDPGKLYGDDELGAVVNIILRRRETGGVVFEVQGKVKDFSYAGSVGMTRAWFKESEEDHAYYTFTPTVRLSYNLKKAGFLRYRFNISPAIPSLGSLTDVEQAMDTIQIVRGNPLLKTYQQFTNSLSYSYSKKQFNANLSVRHQYYDNPIMESIFVEDGKLILKDENQRSFQSLNAELMVGINGATLFGLKDFLTLYASGGYTRSWSEGLNYSHMYDEFYYSVMAQMQYKDFSLLGQFRKVQNNFFGETIKKNENQTAFMAMYTRRNLQAGIGIMFPFTNNYKVGKERISEVAPFRSETFVRETGQMVVLRMGYTFEFGRKHKAGNKGLNNSDTDSGIINMQR